MSDGLTLERELVAILRAFVHKDLDALNVLMDGRDPAMMFSAMAGYAAAVSNILAKHCGMTLDEWWAENVAESIRMELRQ